MATFIFCIITMVLCGSCLADRDSFDCKMKQLAIDFARKIQPFRTKLQFQQIADALNGAKESQNCSVSIDMIEDRQWKPPSFSVPESDMIIYVDANEGSDSNSGSMSSPFKTISKAIEASRRTTDQPTTLILRKGTFYLTETIQITSEDSGLTIMNYHEEEVWISGARPIHPQWTAVSTSGGKNVYMTDLSTEKFNEILGLRINGKRGIRARYPNADPELQGFGSQLQAKSWLKPTLPDKEIHPDTPSRPIGGMFQKYQLGVGGPCKNFDPPAGYWCSNKTEGGGAFTYRVPSGMIADKSVLPHQPYKNATGAIVQTWRPGHWASWMFEVGNYDADKTQFTFSKGGFQGARGNDRGDEFYIENVLEELDYPNEWYYDTQTMKLFFYYNATSGMQPPDDTIIEVVQLKTFFNATSSQQSPIKGLSLMGVNFKDSAYTYMDPHGMPSGGDWALERMGVLYFEGTENTLVDTCIFQRLDSNAIMVSGYNRNVTIQNNEFVWIGSSAIAQWGYIYTRGVDGVPGMGWDGTDGNQPRFSKILYNFVHELGIWEKQSSFYFQAKSCQNIIKGNIFFNGPRAGINFNDAFGGDSNVTENLLFNTCRESGDHGPFNSWDRQVYVTKVRNGTASTVKQYDYISLNFMIANYNSKMGTDNDDGSSYYETHDNFFTYGSMGGLKSNFGGHDIYHHKNVYGYINEGFHIITTQQKGHNNMFYNNDVVLNKDGDYGTGQACSGDGKTIVHDNKIYTPNGKVTECGKDLAKWQAEGNDPGTTAAKWPTDDLLEMIKNLLTLTSVHHQ